MKQLLLLSWMALSLLGHQALAQDRAVSGKVTSADDGEALPGVSVTVKGSTTGTATSSNGTYQLNVPANSTLVFSFIGLNSSCELFIVWANSY